MNGTIITTKGIALITKLVAQSTPLTFSRMAVGTGKVPTGFDPAGMVNLNNYKMDGSISAVEAANDIATIVGQISSIGITEGFTITEAGIFAMDPDDGEILYAYLDMSNDPQYIFEDGKSVSKFVEITLNVVIGQVSSVTASIDVSSLVTKEMLEQEINGVKNDLSNLPYKLIEDLNNIDFSTAVPINIGIYYHSSANKPTVAGGMVITYKAGESGTQLAMANGSTNLYVRKIVNGVFDDNWVIK